MLFPDLGTRESQALSFSPPPPLHSRVLLEILEGPQGKANSNQNRDTYLGKGKIKLPLLVDGMTAHKENPKESTKKLSELRGKSSKTAGYMVHLYPSPVFLHASTEQLRIKISKAVQFIILLTPAPILENFDINPRSAC